MSRRSRRVDPTYNRDYIEAVAQSLAYAQYQKDLDQAQLNSMKEVPSQATQATAIMQFTRPVSPRNPVSPRKSKSGFFARFFDNSSSKKKRDNRVAPDYSVPAPNHAPLDPATIDPNDTMLQFEAPKPTSQRSLRSRIGFGSSRVDPRHAGIRRSRKMRKSKRRKGRKGRTRRRRQ